MNMTMRKYILVLAAVLLWTGCSYYKGNPEFDEDEIPYIYCESTGAVNVYAGQPYEVVLVVTPSDGSVQCRWSLDGETIAETSSLSAVAPEEPGQYQLLFEAQRGEQFNTRSFTLYVQALVEEEPEEPDQPDQPAEPDQPQIDPAQSVIHLNIRSFPSRGANVLVSAPTLNAADGFKLSVTDDTVTATESEGSTLFAYQGTGKYGQTKVLDLVAPAGVTSDISVKIYTVSEDTEIVYAEKTVQGLVLEGGKKTELDFVTSILLADFEGEKAAISDQTGKWTVSDNPATSSTVNPSAKAYYSSGWAGTEGNIEVPYFTLNPSVSNTAIPNVALRSYARAAAVKMYVGADAGKYFPFVRIGWSGSYFLPKYINGQSVTADNAASLVKADDWNTMVWEYSQWKPEPFEMNIFCIRPVKDAEGNDPSVEGERKIYYDDFELLF